MAMKSQLNKEKHSEVKTSTKKPTTQPFSAIVLAAGKGTRMKSPLPKVLHPVAGQPMIGYVIDACRDSGCEELRVVVGHMQNLVRQVVEPMAKPSTAKLKPQDLSLKVYVQTEQLGTAHAVRSADVDTLNGEVVILNGDHPLIAAEDIQSILQQFRSSQLDLAVVTVKLKDPGEFGRIVRHHGMIKAIVEAKDASAETLKIKEVNTGIYVVKADVLSDYLPKIQNQNSKKEFYLTDIIGLCIDDQLKVGTVSAPMRVSRGVNDQIQLAIATRYHFKKKIKSLMENGVVVIDPACTYIETNVQIGSGTVVYPNVYVRGNTTIGSFCVLEPNVQIMDSVISNGVQIKAGSYIERSVIEDQCTVGPYARLRPETELGSEAHIGNFVELKKVKFGKKSKAGHLTYLGDAEIGEDVNIGCGTITCNYAVDKKKYRTKIGNRVFVGSDSQFVAPIEVGDDAIIASGSTITENVPAKSLAIARGKQVNKDNYKDKLDQAARAEQEQEQE